MISEFPQVDPENSYKTVFLFPIASLFSEREDLYDSTRHYWDVSAEWQGKSNAVAIGIVKGQSMSAYFIEDWHPAESKFEFHGTAINEGHELLHRDFKQVIAAARGYWGYGRYLIVEFDGNGYFRILRGSKDKTWKPLRRI